MHTVHFARVWHTFCSAVYIIKWWALTFRSRPSRKCVKYYIASRHSNAHGNVKSLNNRLIYSYHAWAEMMEYSWKLYFCSATAYTHTYSNYAMLVQCASLFFMYGNNKIILYLMIEKMVRSLKSEGGRERVSVESYAKQMNTQPANNHFK